MHASHRFDFFAQATNCNLCLAKQKQKPNNEAPTKYVEVWNENT